MSLPLPPPRRRRKSPRLQARAGLSEGYDDAADLRQFVNLAKRFNALSKTPSAADHIKACGLWRLREQFRDRYLVDLLDENMATIFNPSLAQNDRAGVCIGIALLWRQGRIPTISPAAHHDFHTH